MVRGGTGVKMGWAWGEDGVDWRCRASEGRGNLGPGGPLPGLGPCRLVALGLCGSVAVESGMRASSVLGKVEEIVETIYVSVMPTEFCSLGKDSQFQDSVLCCWVFPPPGTRESILI